MWQTREEVGDPLMTDHLPSDATTRVLWTTTDRMCADALTGWLVQVMDGSKTDLTPTKEYRCENEDDIWQGFNSI